MAGGSAGKGEESEANAQPEAGARSDCGVPATRSNRLRSAALWGAIGGFAFLVVTQGYLLVGGSLPFAYPWLFGMAAVLTAVVAVIAYRVEHRIGRKRSKRRT